MRRRAVILDTNLLVLFVVGVASPDYIATHKRLRAYTNSDFTLLKELLKPANRVIVTPHVLAETSNMAGHANEPARTHIMKTFRGLLAKLDERHRPCVEVAERPEFVVLGLADAALLALDDSDATLLTADLDLYLAARRAGRPAVNFTHHKATYL